MSNPVLMRHLPTYRNTDFRGRLDACQKPFVLVVQHGLEQGKVGALERTIDEAARCFVARIDDDLKGDDQDSCSGEDDGVEAFHGLPDPPSASMDFRGREGS